MKTTSWTEWGVRFGDGEVDYDYMEREYAEKAIADIRVSIAEYDFDADDYEPMTVVYRDVTQDVAVDWTEAS